VSFFYHQGAARDEVAPMKNINKKLINNIFSDLRKAANHPLLCTTRFSGNLYGCQPPTLVHHPI